MAKYLIRAAYNADGIKGLLKEGGSKRKSTVEKLVKGLGGKVESFYYSQSDLDAFVIIDFPDPVNASAIMLAINSTGVVTCSAVPLLTPADVDAAAATSVGYRAPGK